MVVRRPAVTTGANMADPGRRAFLVPLFAPKRADGHGSGLSVREDELRLLGVMALLGGARQGGP